MKFPGKTSKNEWRKNKQSSRNVNYALDPEALDVLRKLYIKHTINGRALDRA